MAINVLWVEEEPSSLRYERSRVAQLGWNLIECTTVAEAVKLIQNHTFDLIILDLILPKDESTLKNGMVDTEAGISLLKYIRDPQRLGKTALDVPVLVVSAIGSPEQRFEVIKMLTSERHFIRKPINLNIFIQIIHELNKQLTK
jgi:CheY-like chemotaxis protein